MNPKAISVNDYDYHLPDERIALHPLAERDASKLLVYKNGNIEETVFSSIDKYLPEKSLLVFNNSKVINARIKFIKTTGAVIEIFCLEPHGNINDYSSVMAATNSVQWKCFVGGGLYMPDSTLLKKLRNEINFFHKDLTKILKDPLFVKTYGGLDINDRVMLKRPPKGYDANHPAIEYVKLFSFKYSIAG